MTGAHAQQYCQIWKHNNLGDIKEPEPQPNKGTTMVLKLTEGLGLNEAGIKTSVKLFHMSSEQQQPDKKL